MKSCMSSIMPKTEPISFSIDQEALLGPLKQEIKDLKSRLELLEKAINGK